MQPITGFNIQKRRIIAGHSLKTLSQVTNIAKSTLSELENHTQHPSVWTMRKIAKALDCNIEDLLRSGEGKYIKHGCRTCGK